MDKRQVNNAKLPIFLGVLIATVLTGFIYVSYQSDLELLQGEQYAFHHLPLVNIERITNNSLIELKSRLIVPDSVREYAEALQTEIAALENLGTLPPSLGFNEEVRTALIEQLKAYQTELYNFDEIRKTANAQQISQAIILLQRQGMALNATLDFWVDRLREYDLESINSYQAEIQSRTGRSILISLLTMIIAVASMIYFIRLNTKAEILAEKNHELAQQSAQESQIKSRLLAMLSHEIRTPMNGIIGLSSLMAEDAQNDNDKTMLNEIRSSAVQLMNRMGELLQFTDNMHEPKLTLPKLFFENLEREIQEIAHNHEREFTYRLHTPPPAWIYCAQDSVHHALVNLFGYIFKNSPQDILAEIDFEKNTLIMKIDFTFDRFYETSWNLENITGQIQNPQSDIASDQIETTISRSIIQELGGNIQLVEGLGGAHHQRLLLTLPIHHKAHRPIRVYAENVAILSMIGLNNPMNEDWQLLDEADFAKADLIVYPRRDFLVSPRPSHTQSAPYALVIYYDILTGRYEQIEHAKEK